MYKKIRILYGRIQLTEQSDALGAIFSRDGRLNTWLFFVPWISYLTILLCIKLYLYLHLADFLCTLGQPYPK